VFRTYTLRGPIQYTITGNEVALIMEPESLDAFTRAMESQATVEAMALDGVKRETVKTFEAVERRWSSGSASLNSSPRQTSLLSG
jgi:hypothetical protein